MTNRKEDRVVVVTGASRGIGRAAALMLAAAGAHVIAVARTVGALEELDDEIRAKGGAATLVPLDLKDFAGIDRLGAAIFSRWGRLDGLLGNAGLLGSLDPLLRRSDAGRAVFLTSGVTYSFPPYWSAYSVSKAALEALVRTYAGEVAQTRVRANLVNPGPLRTKMRAQAMPGEDPNALKPPDALVPDLVRMLSPDFDRNGVLFDFPTGETREFSAG